MRRKKVACTRQNFRYLVVKFPNTTISKAGNLVDISIHSHSFVNRTPMQRVLHTPSTHIPFPHPYAGSFHSAQRSNKCQRNVNSVNKNTDYLYITVLLTFSRPTGVFPEGNKMNLNLHTSNQSMTHS